MKFTAVLVEAPESSSHDDPVLRLPHMYVDGAHRWYQYRDSETSLGPRPRQVQHGPGMSRTLNMAVGDNGRRSYFTNHRLLITPLSLPLFRLQANALICAPNACPECQGCCRRSLGFMFVLCDPRGVHELVGCHLPRGAVMPLTVERDMVAVTGCHVIASNACPECHGCCRRSLRLKVMSLMAK
ncbi:hypothetical protein J6590_026960 [Homalodisca vitripennis]|nr:hypothetical protein J6590_026960 [Homalodisca vitripennis]